MKMNESAGASSADTVEANHSQSGKTGQLLVVYGNFRNKVDKRRKGHKGHRRGDAEYLRGDLCPEQSDGIAVINWEKNVRRQSKSA